MLTNRSHNPLYIPLLLAVCGVIFSIWNAQDASSVPCVSSGCTLYQSFSINGFSLWWAGIAIFTLLGLLALTRHAVLGRWLSGLAVLLDCGLLLIMILTLPCLACMTAALLLALSYMAFRSATQPERRNGLRRHASPLLIVWSALFLLTLGGLARSAIEPWAIRSPEVIEEATARVFFSPSCSACRQLVMGMSDADARRVIWCPIAEEEKDLAIILNLKRRLDEGTPLNRAFIPSLETPSLSFFEMFHPDVLLTQFRLWCNAAQVITTSNGRLPLVAFMGVPSALVKGKASPEQVRTPAPSAPVAPAAPATRPAPAPRPAPAAPQFGGQSMINGHSMDQNTLPFDMGSDGSCGGPNAVPCP